MTKVIISVLRLTTFYLFMNPSYKYLQCETTDLKSQITLDIN